MEKYKRRAVYALLNNSNFEVFDPSLNEGDFIEVCEWKNGEGFDVEVVSTLSGRFQLTYGQFNALKKLVKVLNK